jgi:hypothetical protein
MSTTNHRLRREMSIVSAMLVCSIAGGSALRAQTTCSTAPPTNSCATDVSLTLATVPTMDLRLSSSDVAFPRVAAAELHARSVRGSAVTAVIRSNVPWQLQIALAGDEPPPAAGQPSDLTPGLQWSTTPNGDFAELGRAPSPVASGEAGAAYRITLHFRKRVDWYTTPGTYQHVIASTLIAP